MKTVDSRIGRQFGFYKEFLYLMGLKRSVRSAGKKIVQKMGGYPKSIAVEASSWCNLNCAFCVTQAIRVWEHRGNKFLALETFKKLVDEIEFFCHRIDFSCYGEPLLNPDLADMISYAGAKGMWTSVFTNATFLSEDNVNKLLDSGLIRIYASLESFDSGIYESTKVGARLAETRSHIQQLIREKKKRGLKVPQVVLRFVVTRKTAPFFAEFLQSAQDIGADAVSPKPLDIWPQGDASYKQKMLEEYVIDHPVSNYRKGPDGRFRRVGRKKGCPSLNTPEVLSDGSVCLCWFDSLGETVAGNIHNENFVTIWKRTARFRENTMNKGDAFSICKECPGGIAHGQRIIALRR